ncbi:hypothetical protein HMPREF9104_00045 [Lentilactobacillus kisonensis F0435]|uniref:Uncharacterized protein n=1 Tax=Lentilactobacillus kisonensis F0435 TaxID=797516 RepID=H1LBT5_9LACO|nr:hypothetical protein HMPREF9104_00045 [Lentilactobacillus kisonensis F0435]
MGVLTSQAISRLKFFFFYNQAIPIAYLYDPDKDSLIYQSSKSV